MGWKGSLISEIARVRRLPLNRLIVFDATESVTFLVPSRYAKSVKGVQPDLRQTPPGAPPDLVICYDGGRSAILQARYA